MLTRIEESLILKQLKMHIYTFPQTAPGVTTLTSGALSVCGIKNEHFWLNDMHHQAVFINSSLYAGLRADLLILIRFFLKVSFLHISFQLRELTSCLASLTSLIKWLQVMDSACKPVGLRGAPWWSLSPMKTAVKCLPVRTERIMLAMSQWCNEGYLGWGSRRHLFNRKPVLQTVAFNRQGGP